MRVGEGAFPFVGVTALSTKGNQMSNLDFYHNLNKRKFDQNKTMRTVAAGTKK